jgi:hypothetical protein
MLRSNVYARALRERADPAAVSSRDGGVSERCELQNAMFPEGLPYSEKKGFFEPGKSKLINPFVEMMLAVCQVGVPDGI